MTIAFHRGIPAFRIFSLEKARQFYVGFPGFKVDWEHRFESAPAFMREPRAGLSFYHSGHHDDGTPVAFVSVTGVRELRRELNDKKYRYNRPGPQEQEWGMTELTVIDPFANRHDLQRADREDGRMRPRFLNA
jgi:catechol 2,3-dioxygenase-like lactoylglutathione lyase family enzyme